MDELPITVATRDVSIVYVSETWFKDYNNNNNTNNTFYLVFMGSSSLTLQEFCLERKDRSHGGVACYVRNDLMYKRRLLMKKQCGLRSCQNKMPENSHVYCWHAYIILQYRSI